MHAELRLMINFIHLEGLPISENLQIALLYNSVLQSSFAL